MKNYFNITLYIVLFLVLVLSATVLFPAWKKYKQAENSVNELKEKFNNEKSKYLTLQNELNDLEHNAFAIEQIARKELNYCREGEIVYVYNE